MEEIKVNFRGNSKMSRQQPEKPSAPREKVVTGKVKLRKKSIGKMVSETITGDDLRTVLDYVVLEVAIPSLKDLFFEMFTGGLERSMWSGGRRGARHSVVGRGSQPQYNRMYNGSASASSSNQSEISHQARARHDFGEIIFDSRGDAMDILENLSELISLYETATVADLYDFCGMNSSPIDKRWGWKNLATASPSRTRDGYILDLPRPIELD